MKFIDTALTTITAIAATLSASGDAKAQSVELRIIQTSDVHGNAFPYDFIRQAPGLGSLSRVASYVKSVRYTHGDNVILLDNGDILQGQPTAYYYDFVDTTSQHLFASVMQHMRYDAAVVGNHDIETGHEVYDRWAAQCGFPILAANLIDTVTQKPYFRPYTMIERSGIRIAVLGLTTPSVPQWVPEKSWSGLAFLPMLQYARQWMEVIRRDEKPDVIIGLFHSGKEGGSVDGDIIENACLEIARSVPGFDVIFMGHDHRLACERVTSADGREVWIADPGSRASYVSEASIRISKDSYKSAPSKEVSVSLVPMDDLVADEEFMQTFSKEYAEVQSFVSQRIGTLTTPLHASESFFGSSPFMDFIHTIQLQFAPDADISFAAPLSTNAYIAKGNVTVADMFKLYAYENSLYVMQLTGREVKDYLEMSYSKWVNTISDSTQHIIKVKADDDTTGYRSRFLYPTFNFDSAAGIIYTVDVSQAEGNRISIISMSDSTPFSLSKTYRVALSSYRANGGGELLTKGAGIVKELLKNRIEHTSTHDLRYYMMNYIKQHDTINPPRLHNWRFVPDSLAQPAIRHDREYIFGRD